MRRFWQLSLLTLTMASVACDDGKDKSSSGNKSTNSDACSPYTNGAPAGTTAGANTQQSQPGINQGQTGQTAGYQNGQTTQNGTMTGNTGTNTGTGQSSFGLAAGTLFTQIQGDCANCHNGTTDTGTDGDDYKDPAVVTADGAEILARIDLEPGAAGMMPSAASAKVTWLTSAKAWQMAGFPDVSTWDEMGDGGMAGNNGSLPNTQPSGNMANANQYGNYSNCPPPPNQQQNQQGSYSGGGTATGGYGTGTNTQPGTGGFGQPGTMGGTQTGTQTGNETNGATTF